MQTLTQTQRDWDTKVFAQIQQASEGHHPQLSRYVQELLAYSGFSRPTTVIPYDPQGPSGWVRATENSIEWACSWPIIDLDHLFVLAHEVFHVLQANSLEVMRSCPQKLLELEAEMFAYQYFEKRGLEVTAEMDRATRSVLKRHLVNKAYDLPGFKIETFLLFRRAYISIKPFVLAWINGLGPIPNHQFFTILERDNPLRSRAGIVIASRPMRQGEYRKQGPRPPLDADLRQLRAA